MKTCNRCGQAVSLWEVDLTTGLCGDCRRAEQRTLREKQETAEIARQQAIEAQQREQIEARFGRCEACDGPFQPIKLIDATGPGWDQEGAAHIDLSYASAEATASLFLGKVPRRGVVRGLICAECGRITLYGE